MRGGVQWTAWVLLLGGGLPSLGVAADEVAPSAVADDEPPPGRYEFGLLPALSYNSDLGVGVGAVGTLARFDEGFNPFRWRLEGNIFLTLRDEGNGIEVPYQSHRLELDMPGLAQGDLRLSVGLAFNRQVNSGYYGMGSAAPDESGEGVPAARTQYDRIFPEVSLGARIRLWSEPVAVGKRRLEAVVGTSLRFTWLDFAPDSRLGLDLESARAGDALSRLLFGVEDHVLWQLYAGLLFDTRDREFDPVRGSFHEVTVRMSPGVDASLLYGGAAAIVRWYVPLGTPRLSLGLRSAADLLFGDVPVYELARLGAFDPTEAPGGAKSLRGVPLRRYHGKVKLLQSFELRGRIVPFRLGDQRFEVGAIAFADVGRVWGDYTHRTIEVRSTSAPPTTRALDGDFGDLDVGVGGGARLRWGETFLVRIDLGYSPTLDTTGFYVGIGDAF